MWGYAGQTPVRSGGSLRFPTQVSRTPCLKFCQAFGLDVTGAEIESLEDQTVLSVRCFDRLWDREGLFHR